MKTQKQYKADFVGEFYVPFERIDSIIPKIGDVAIWINPEENDKSKLQILIRCGCGETNILPLGVDDWLIEKEHPIQITPSIKTIHNFTPQTTCHYVVQKGKLIMLEDTTSTLKEQ